ncbi:MULTISPECIES: helix-hairpin-helix domain-containing protein [unclassified Streptomyces]|uniref:helix-hairpin-helix domain-containing protein n=1 Tax=unclassified Streptomyces TaxID=2593676 RepID=UPI00074855D1|nr:MULTISPECIES: helix-hairpin-helix domain-containing protein [unclassified Streptomyces]KUL72722.1 DNA helicase RecD [Streptomyces sp. NRRL WC-3604]KUL74464.1 DNA helicase RecD [Streptomyces sp. NRRL WC-3605]
MSTEPPESTEDAEPVTPAAGDEPAGTDGPVDGPPEETATAPAAEGDAAKQLSEAEAELAAQRLERERIERRKAEKQGPVTAGAKLSGKAADLLAAVRAVESGAKPAATVFSEPEPPRRPAPEPVSRPAPVAEPGAPSVPAPESVEAVRRVLTEGGAPETLAPQVAAALGESAAQALPEDPWQLLRVPGVRPEQADGFARALLGAECAPDDERRGRAVTGWLLEQAALAGHTALELPALTAALARQGVPDPDAAVQDTLAEGEALAFQDALDQPGAPAAASGGAGEEGGDEERPVRVLVGLERYALAEESLADGLARLINSAPKQDGSAEDWERAAGGSGSAAELIRAVAAHGLVLHTGGEASLAEPAALLRAAEALGLRAWAAAHTPAGRDRFAALPDGPEAGAGRTAATVAGLLSGAEGPGRDTDGALDLDLLVVLDAPLLDVETAALLTESLPDGARLVLAGDPGVLWSAGPGRVFADLLAARVCPQIASRRPDPGPLGELVSGIGIGELIQVEAPGKEVVIVPVRDAGEAVHRTVQLVADSVPRAIGVPPEETQVITPGHGGAAGTRALNAALKARLNPGPGRFGGFDPGDRVAYSPAPGRTVPGQVVGADAEGLRLTCAGEAVLVPRERVEQSVRHGWALTAHQAAGGRWPAAVVVLPGDAAQALSRPWVYTAFSRADRHLSVVHGVEQALPRAVAEVPAKPRTTRLAALLRPQVPTPA